MKALMPISPRRSGVAHAFARGYALSVAALAAPILILFSWVVWKGIPPNDELATPTHFLVALIFSLQAGVALGAIMAAVVLVAHRASRRIRGAFRAAPVLAVAAILTLASANVWLVKPLSTSVMVSGVLIAYLTAGFAAMWVPVDLARRRAEAQSATS